MLKNHMENLVGNEMEPGRIRGLGRLKLPQFLGAWRGRV